MSSNVTPISKSDPKIQTYGINHKFFTLFFIIVYDIGIQDRNKDYD